MQGWSPSRSSTSVEKSFGRFFTAIGGSVTGNIYDNTTDSQGNVIDETFQNGTRETVAVQMADVDDPAKVVLITSSVPRESKSTVALSLAYSALKAGLRSVIIDGDLRHPSVSKFFGLEKGPGLVDLLTGTMSAEQTIMSRDGIIIIPAGSKSQNPPDLLGSARMEGASGPAATSL
jgi:Mrp family chromosome partitioning ATPase